MLIQRQLRKGGVVFFSPLFLGNREVPIVKSPDAQVILECKYLNYTTNTVID